MPQLEAKEKLLETRISSFPHMTPESRTKFAKQLEEAGKPKVEKKVSTEPISDDLILALNLG